MWLQEHSDLRSMVVGLDCRLLIQRIEERSGKFLLRQTGTFFRNTDHFSAVGLSHVNKVNQWWIFVQRGAFIVPFCQLVDAPLNKTKHWSELQVAASSNWDDQIPLYQSFISFSPSKMYEHPAWLLWFHWECLQNPPMLSKFPYTVTGEADLKAWYHAENLAGNNQQGQWRSCCLAWLWMHAPSENLLCMPLMHHHSQDRMTSKFLFAMIINAACSSQSVWKAIFRRGYLED